MPGSPRSWIGLSIVALIVAGAGCGEESSQVVCNASTCSGCCTATGACVPGNTTTQCGSGGQACSACQSGTCTGGRCVSCDPTTCPDGCCKGGQCLPGTLPSACGALGAPCQECNPEQECNEGNCTSAGECDPTSCPDGCCDGGECRAGDTDPACGQGGVLCQACEPPKTTCVDQRCQGANCNAATCPDGCCDVSDQCQPGNIEAFCGKGGEPCQKCAQGDACLDQECGPPGACDAQSCPGGCCDASDQCQPGTDKTACGSGGEPCQACGASESCTQNQCISDPKAQWTLTVVSAVIESPPAGQVWDPNPLWPGFEKPDAFVKITVGSASGKTGTEDNSYAPQFNDKLFTTTVQNILKPMLVQMYDEENFGSPQLMGQCTVNVNQQDLNAGLYNVQSCGGPDIKVINLKFTKAP